LRAGWLRTPELEHVLAALMPENRLALEVCLSTGLRVSDALCLKTAALERAGHHDGRLTVRELKTGKNRRVRIPMELLLRCMDRAGRVYVFEGRFDRLRHRTRQAVWKDLHRAAKLFRLDVHVSPHSTRKAWAVDEMHRCHDLRKVQREMCHSDPSITMLYAMADELERRKRGH
jgi:site-specific recombinase XerD